MENKIYKYELEIIYHQKIDMPIGAQVLSAKEQDGKLCVWALIDTRLADTTKTKDIFIVGTGRLIDFSIGEYSLNFVDTVVMSDEYVWHVFA